jgi:hypothetical protein
MAESPPDQSFGLRLAFDSDDPEFTRGFEVGRYDTLLNFEDFVEGYLHPENAEMVMRVAESHSFDVVAKDIGHGWMWVTFTKRVL